MKTIKRKILLSSAMIAPILPALTLVSCVQSGGNILQHLNYDFGLAVAPINNLNYLKFDLGQIQPSIIFPLIEKGPKGNLKNILELPEFKAQGLIQKSDGTLITDSSFITLSEYTEYAGAIDSADNSYLYLPIQGGDFTDPLQSVIIHLNKKIMWKGAHDPQYNRAIKAQDYIDGLKYMIDINNGSQLAARLLTTGIIGIKEFYNAQISYVENIGQTYSDPWGYNIDPEGIDFTRAYGHLKSENPGDTPYVARIEMAARMLMGQGLVLNHTFIDGIAPNEYDLRINFSNVSQVDFLTFDQYFYKYLIPANREFIEDIGGIYKFGSSLDNFIYSSPFNITDARLGQGGFISLEKDDSFYSSKYTMSDKIKIYFQDDPNILSSMFKDGYISGTKVSATYLSRFWADQSLRQYMNKAQGFGTVAIRYNQTSIANPDYDPNYFVSSNDPTYDPWRKMALIPDSSNPLNDPDLRLAIAYSIKRDEYIKLAGWDSAATTALWNVKGISSTTDGRSLDTFYDQQTYQDTLSDDDIALTSTDYMERTYINSRFEHGNRHDARYNFALANQHLDRFLAKRHQSSFTLSFLCTGNAGSKQGLGLQSQFNKTFNHKLRLSIHSVPASSYTNMINHGDWDLAVDNFDKFGSSSDAYYRALVWPDEINHSANKTSGYLNNPTGSWTFSRWYARVKHEHQLDQMKQKLGIVDGDENDYHSDAYIWKWFTQIVNHSFVFSKENEDLVDGILANRPLINDDHFDSEQIARLFVLMEKIIAIDAPVVPLFEVDTTWTISRLVGLPSLYEYSLQFAYDELKPPRDNLPRVGA